jgi:hypothetical protein
VAPSPGWIAAVACTPSPVSTAKVCGAVPSFVTSNVNARPCGAWIMLGVIANSESETRSVAGAGAAPSSDASSPAAVQPLMASITITVAASAAYRREPLDMSSSSLACDGP